MADDGGGSMRERVERSFEERFNRFEGQAATMSEQMRRWERAYDGALEDEIRACIQDISRTPGPHPDHVWEAASQWLVPISVEGEEFIVPYLSAFGYSAQSKQAWRVTPSESNEDSGPVLSFNLEAGHEEHSGHTWYMVDCHLRRLGANDELTGPDGQRVMVPAQDREMRWVSPRRLAQLRECLHSYVKEDLGNRYDGLLAVGRTPPTEDTYGEIFGDTPFAKTGAPPGTTARLAAWLTSLAGAVNSGKVSPAMVARTLFFFRGPPLVKEAEDHVPEDQPGAAEAAVRAEPPPPLPPPAEADAEASPMRQPPGAACAAAPPTAEPEVTVEVDEEPKDEAPTAELVAAVEEAGIAVLDDEADAGVGGGGEAPAAEAAVEGDGERPAVQASVVSLDEAAAPAAVGRDSL